MFDGEDIPMLPLDGDDDDDDNIPDDRVLPHDETPFGTPSADPDIPSTSVFKDMN